MTERAALLIGVPSCSSSLFEPIEHIVAADIRRMKDALVQSDYRITCCGTETGATFNEINFSLKKAFREAPAGGTLLVYYSGHGVIANRRSYLVPSDAYDNGSSVDPDSLVPLFSSGLDACPARTIVFFVDACRNDISGAMDLPGGGDLPYPPNGAVILVTSCSPGERSGFGHDGSYFTQALADALDRRSPARTVREVFDAATRQLARRGALSDAASQTPAYAATQGGSPGGSPEAAEICTGDQVVEAWRRAVETTPLWKRAAGDADATNAAQDAVLGVVELAGRQWLAAHGRLADVAHLADPWSTPDFPVRVLARLDELLPEDAELTNAELVCAVASPFLREVALGAGLILAAGIHPRDFTRTYESGARNDLEITHDMHEHVWRRAEGLARRDRLEARDTLAMWLVHRWLAGRASIWEDPAVVELTGRIGSAAGPDSGLTARELSGHLRVLMGCVDGDLDENAVLVRLKTGFVELRLRTIGALLWLAGVLAADPRRMPSVIVDHIGVTDELSLATVHEAVRAARWISSGDQLALRMVCDHPALFTVFEGLVKRADGVRRALAEVELHPELAGGLPTTVIDSQLRPETIDSKPAFDTPVLRFRLSDEKVRELLMGRQLYGEPDLAIRELYQNALDACRYRRTRRQYLNLLGRDTTAWIGRITIEQGVENGRTYIQCSDNGIGMGEETLKNTFANAGERFVYRPAFRAEHARWQELDASLELIPNSQFGVGVFSYFMIAEEIEIWTWPTSEDDVPDRHGFCVRIASSGSLFQITPATQPAGGGTRVRLYLTGDDAVSALKTMRRLLRVAEFSVEVTDSHGQSESWKPEELRYPGSSVTPLPHGGDFWWVTGEGGLAADGIRTNEERFGMVVNLRGRRRPRFTVDRNRLRRWDRDWIDTQVTESLPRLADWQGLTFNWLWNVTDDNPHVSEKIFAWLVDHHRSLPVEGSWAHGTTPPADRIGCLPADRKLFSGELGSWTHSYGWLSAWRTAVWRGYARFDFTDDDAIPVSLQGFPLASPLDAAVIGQLFPSRYMGGSWYGRPELDELLQAAASEDEPPADRMRRLRRYAIVGLDLAAMRDIPPVRHRFHDKEAQPENDLENRQLLPAVAAWAPPGQPPRRGAGVWLASASLDLHVPVEEVIRRASALVPPTWTPPDSTVVAQLGHQVFTTSEVEMLSRKVDANPPG